MKPLTSNQSLIGPFLFAFQTKPDATANISDFFEQIQFSCCFVTSTTTPGTLIAANGWFL